MKATRTVRALRDFPYAADGINVTQISKGEERPIVTDILDGLIAEGYVEEIESPAVADEGGTNSEQGDRPLSPTPTDPGLLSAGSGQEQPSSASHQGRRSRRNR